MGAEQRVDGSPAEAAIAEADADQFAYIVSHDLNAPLRAISGFMQLLSADYADRLDDQGRDWLQRAVDSTHRMQRMLEDLRTYSRIKAPNAKGPPVALADVLTDVTVQIGAQLRELGATITSDSLPAVRGDLAHLTSLLQQLLDNALKFRSTATPRIHVGVQDDGTHWIVSVSDNGLGIDPKHHARIFEMFKKLHQPDAYPGTGAGLALARRIVLLHGGRIWVESTLGAGARFLFSIPQR
jgi:light-regulated signal transduction histidine kinase (bacteriophytochrome)